jgi:hypothetical protein
MQDIHSGVNPFCESVVATLRFVECGDLLSKDGEDTLGGFAGLKAGKERVRDQVLLSLKFVRFQSGVENARKVGLRGGGGGGSWGS